MQALEQAQAPSMQQLVDGAVAMMVRSPTAIFSLADMLLSLCQQDDGKARPGVLKALVVHLQRAAEVSSSPCRRMMWRSAWYPLVAQASLRNAVLS